MFLVACPRCRPFSPTISDPQAGALAAGWASGRSLQVLPEACCLCCATLALRPPRSPSRCGAVGQSPASQAISVRPRSPRQARALAGMPAFACRSRRRLCKDARWRKPCHSCTPARRRGCAASTSARKGWKGLEGVGRRRRNAPEGAEHRCTGACRCVRQVQREASAGGASASLTWRRREQARGRGAQTGARCGAVLRCAVLGPPCLRTTGVSAGTVPAPGAA